jgi:hypothetical protein
MLPRPPRRAESVDALRALWAEIAPEEDPEPLVLWRAARELAALDVQPDEVERVLQAFALSAAGGLETLTRDGARAAVFDALGR